MWVPLCEIIYWICICCQVVYFRHVKRSGKQAKYANFVLLKGCMKLQFSAG